MTEANRGSGPYAALTPDLILNAVDSVGGRTDGRLLALNSYENRVYQVGIDDGPPLVAKFYRPERWSDEAILEEHAFVAQLAEAEIPVVPAIASADGSTLHRFGGFRFALFPKLRGRAPELEDRATLEWMGRFLARIHAIGTLHPFGVRPVIDIASFGDEPREFLLCEHFIPEDIEPAWRSVADLAIQGVRRCFERAGNVAILRLHGDCHAGNVLWTEEGPHFVDFDDSRMGPAIQDLWMLLSGERESMERQLGWILARLRAVPRVRRSRAESDRSATHAAPDSLFRMDSTPLERSGVSHSLSLVQHPALLAGPHTRIARAGGIDGRVTAASGLIRRRWRDSFCQRL